MTTLHRSWDGHNNIPLHNASYDLVSSSSVVTGTGMVVCFAVDDDLGHGDLIGLALPGFDDLLDGLVVGG